MYLHPNWDVANPYPTHVCGTSTTLKGREWLWNNNDPRRTPLGQNWQKSCHQCFEITAAYYHQINQCQIPSANG